MATEHDVKCGECGAKMRLRTDSRFNRGPWYSCSRYPACRGSHGAHPDGRPLGIPGDRKTKDARIRAHEAFNTLYESGELTKSEAYRWLAGKMQLDKDSCHIGNFNVEQCEQVVALVNERSPSLDEYGPGDPDPRDRYNDDYTPGVSKDFLD